MPNYVKTVIKFKNVKKKDDFDFIIRMIARPLDETDPLFSPDYEDWSIDFNKIIPEPTTKEECPEEYLVPEDSFLVPAAREDRPWFNWHNWRNHYWGTKWTAQNGYTKREEDDLVFVFNTAWNLAGQIVKRLTVLDYDFEVLYADEDLGHNCGKIIYNTKSNVFLHLIGYEAFIDPRKFAETLWDEY